MVASTGIHRVARIILYVVLLACSCYGNLDCEHVRHELQPCYYYMQYGGYPSEKCCNKLEQEVKLFQHKYKDYEYFYCCMKQIYESFPPPRPVSPPPPSPVPPPTPPPPPPPAKRMEDLLNKCGITPPYKIPGPPYPECYYEH